MNRTNTPVFTVECKLDVTELDKAYLENQMKNYQKLYNISVKHYKQVLTKLKTDSRYIQALAKLKATKTDALKKPYFKELSQLMLEYKLTESEIQKYMNYQRLHAFNSSLGSAIVQKQATSLSGAIKKAVFRGTEVHYRKRGYTKSFEDKSAKSGIVYKKATHTVKVGKKEFKLKPIRKTDVYLKEALTNKVKYGRIVRKPFKRGYKYFLQIVLEGTAPKKLILGEGRCGIDEGTSTVAYYNGTEANYEVLKSMKKKLND